MVPTDKILHFWVSFALALYRPALSFAAGVGKETYDAFSGGVASAGDLLADAIGILCARIVVPWF